MIEFFRNLSGVNWAVSCPPELHPYYIAFYTPKFGVSINIHPNRLRQMWEGN